MKEKVFSILAKIMNFLINCVFYGYSSYCLYQLFIEKKYVWFILLLIFVLWLLKLDFEKLGNSNDNEDEDEEDEEWDFETSEFKETLKKLNTYLDMQITKENSNKQNG